MATKAASRAVATAMAIAGRASRACDVCASKSARWYCGADAAYLCDRCDTQVHSANTLSLRHERVRLTPSGAPRKLSTNATNSSPPPRKRSISKILHTAPPQMLPSRKRSRTTRPHPHHRAKPTPKAKQSAVKTESKEAELLHQQLTFDDLFDTEDFLITDDTQEVPSLITVAHHDSTSPSPSSELDSFDAFSPDFHAVSSPSEDSFAACFKGKAAHDDDVMSDQFLVPDVFDNCFDTGIEVGCDVSLAGEACFIPGDIPGLDGFEDFGSRELDTLSLDLALRATSPDPDSEAGIEASRSDAPERDEFATGPFAKFFATRPRADATAQLSAESIKSEAKAILKCCIEGMSEEDLRTVPTLRLNYDDVITAWSDRGEPWVNPDGVVPKMDHGGGDDDQSSGGREARVMRYKEKRRSRLFSKTIRYEVRKLNAERRPRMKGRFVKRTNNSS